MSMTKKVFAFGLIISIVTVTGVGGGNGLSTNQGLPSPYTSSLATEYVLGIHTHTKSGCELSLPYALLNPVHCIF